MSAVEVHDVEPVEQPDRDRHHEQRGCDEVQHANLALPAGRHEGGHGAPLPPRPGTRPRFCDPLIVTVQAAPNQACCPILAAMSISKVASMRDAVADLVRDGDTVAIEGFTHLISFTAGHEIIRQRKRDLTLARLTPDLIYDQMIAAGVARKLIFSWLGNPGVGGLGAIRRRIEPATSGGEGQPPRLEIEEYSHFGMVGRYTAGAANLPFYPLRSYFETDMPRANPLIREIESPYGDGKVFAVPPLKPDVTIVHAQRADASGNTQVWGLLGCQKEAAFAADRVIVVVEELVDESVIRADPNRTIIPGLIVDAVVVEPFGAHPSYVQGAYDRDNRFYLDWDAITQRRGRLQAWLKEWVYDLDGRAAYVQKLGPGADRLAQARLGAVRLRRLRGVPLMATVRYLVRDVPRSVAFYRDGLGFEVQQEMLPAFARLRHDDLSLWLAGPASSAARPMPDGRVPEPGGWNRFVIEVDGLRAVVDALRATGATFRNEIVKGPGGLQIVLDDPDGNPIELFEARR